MQQLQSAAGSLPQVELLCCNECIMCSHNSTLGAVEVGAAATSSPGGHGCGWVALSEAARAQVSAGCWWLAVTPAAKQGHAGIYTAGNQH
jgi:hypothetical protein